MLLRYWQQIKHIHTTLHVITLCSRWCKDAHTCVSLQAHTVA
jgi:hypothetical protein